MEELENIKEQFDELMAKAEEIVKKNEKKNEGGRAGGGETYWYVGSSFDVFSNTEMLDGIDSRRWETCNYFKAKEEAYKVSQHIKDYLILRADAKGFEPKGVSLEARYYYVFWGEVCKCLSICYDGGYLSGTIYFETEKDAKASIEKHENIWKRYLGVTK